MITSVVSANVKCGSKGTNGRLWNLAQAENAEQVRAMEFLCQRCKTDWTEGDISIGADLDKVSCSNCYSSNVRITKVKITWLTANDFKD